MTPLINYKDVSVEIRETKILSHFNLQINKGDKILIYGKSGKGKTTLLKLLLGLITPSNGQILYEGEPLTSKNVWELRRNFAYVPQNTEVHRGKVIELIKSILKHGSNSHIAFDPKKINQLIKELNLPADVLDKEYTDLSGGEKQRTLLLITLLLDRPIFLLDEVTASLDGETKKKVVEMFSTTPFTVIVISHDEVWRANSLFKMIKMEEIIE